MKKILVVVATLILVMTCAMMVACGGVEGKYYAKSMAGVEVTGDEAKAYYKLGSDDKLFVSEDGSEEVEIGTWKKAEEGEDKYVFTMMGMDIDVTISGGTLTYKQNGVEFVFKK